MEGERGGVVKWREVMVGWSGGLHGGPGWARSRSGGLSLAGRQLVWRGKVTAQLHQHACQVYLHA